MKKTSLICIALAFILCACQPSQEMIEKAIKQTDAARPTNTIIPATPTPEPTATPTVEPTQEYCNVDEVMKTRDELMPVFDDYTQIYYSASDVKKPEQFLPLLKDLEKIQERYSKLDFPPCMENLNLYTSQSMTELHDSLELAIDEKFDLAVQKIQNSQDYITEAIEEIDKLTECLPNCKP